MENEIIRKQTILIEVLWTSENDFHIKQTCKDITAMECIGILEYSKKNVLVNTLSFGNKGERKRVTIDYVIKNHDISERLKSALKGYVDYFEVVYLDEVDANLMKKKIRNVGRFTENQLIELKQTFLNK